MTNNTLQLVARIQILLESPVMQLPDLQNIRIALINSMNILERLYTRVEILEKNVEDKIEALESLIESQSKWLI